MNFKFTLAFGFLPFGFPYLIHLHVDTDNMSRFKNVIWCLDVFAMIGRTMLKQMGWSTFVHIAASQISRKNLRK